MDQWPFPLIKNLLKKFFRLMPWDASIHEPLRQRLIGGLTDSQISTMSLLGSLGCGLNRSSIFESRSKHGFSWISPDDLCYMVEPPRPAELDIKVYAIYFFPC